MILEGLVTTRDANGLPHLAPMGPTVDANWSHVLLRPFPTSQTFQNLKRDRFGVLHVTDDVRLLAMAAVGRAPGNLRATGLRPLGIGPNNGRRSFITSACGQGDATAMTVLQPTWARLVHSCRASGPSPSRLSAVPVMMRPSG